MDTVESRPESWKGKGEEWMREPARGGREREEERGREREGARGREREGERGREREREGGRERGRAKTPEPPLLVFMENISYY